MKLKLERLALIPLGLALVLPMATAAPIAGVDFENGDDTAWDRTPDDLAPDDGITVSSDWSVYTDGSIPGAIQVQADTNSNTNATSGSFGAKLHQGSTDADPPSSAPTDHYFSWSITIPPNVTLDLADVTFDLRQGTGTDTSTRWAIFNTSLDGGAGGTVLWSIDNPPLRPDWESVTVDLSAPLYQDLSGTTVTFYWYNENSGSDIDSIVVNGTATISEEDNTPPNPDPMTWESVPSAVDFASVTMTATAATDTNGVEYYFEETSGNPGGDDSGWLDIATYVDSGLMDGTTYSYTVTARDKSANQNETAASSVEMVATPENTSSALYAIESFNNNASTASEWWVPGITTITAAPGLTGTDDAGLLLLQSMNPDPANDTGGGDRFQNAGSTNATNGTLITDVAAQGAGGPDGQAAGDGYFEFGIDDGGSASITLASLSFDAMRATTSGSVRGYNIDISIDGGDYADLSDGDIANNRNDGLQSFILPISGATGISSVDFRVRATGGGNEWTNFAINGSKVNVSVQLVVVLSADGSSLNFSWNSQSGKLYDLLASATLDSPVATWWPVDGQTGIAADPSGTNTLSISRPGDPKTFYVLSEYDAPPPPPIFEAYFEANNGGFVFADSSAGAGSPWEWGVPDSYSDYSGTVTAGNGAGSKCWAVELGNYTALNEDTGAYSIPTNAGLRSPAIDLTGVTAATLSFAHAMDVNFDDTLVLNFLDADNGDSVVATQAYSDGDFTAANWEEETLAVPAAALGMNIRLEWHLSVTAPSPTADYLGWYIDDVVVTEN